LECPGGDAAVQVDPVAAVLGLTATDHQLAVLDGDRQILVAEPRHGQRDAVSVFRGRLDVEGRIALVPRFGGAFDQPFQLFKAQKIGMGGKGQFRHARCP
jgi:hypothetical protein